MPRQTVSLGKIFNIPIGLDYSWFLIFTLITWSLATNYFPSAYRQWTMAEYWIVAAVTAILFFGSVLLHELGHSVVALRYKVPVRSITLFIFGGVAQIGQEPPSAAAEFWIAIAGPLTSFALALIFTVLRLIFTSLTPLLALCQYLAYINGSLGLFNLIPGFPLDGGRVFRAMIWYFSHNMRSATLVAAWAGRVVALGFILYGVYQLFRGNVASGLWVAFIGWFLDGAANAQIQQQTLRDHLSGRSVSQAMSRNYTIISPEITLQTLLDEHILGEGRRFFIVEEYGMALGLITLGSIKVVPRQEWSTTTARQIMVPADQMHQVRPEGALWEAVEKMEENGFNQLPVISEGKVMGILSRESVLTYLKTMKEMA